MGGLTVMKKTILHGRGVMSGSVTGEALVCPNSIQGWLGLSTGGVIIEAGHPEEGKSIDGKILIMPASRGSNGWASHFVEASIEGHVPLAWAFTNVDTKCASAIVALEVPAIVDFPPEEDPCKFLKTGDRIRLDGDAGTIEVLGKA